MKLFYFFLKHATIRCMEIVIKPDNRKIFSFQEIWQYRELFYFLAWRDIKVKYKQTVIGVLWAVLQPLVTMIIFTVVFNKVAKVPLGTLPYAVFTLSGLVFWNFFSTTLSTVSDCFIANKHILTKVYFPRIIIPIAAIIVDFVDFVISFVLLIIVLFFFHIPFNPLVLVVLFGLLALVILTVLGIGLTLATLNIKYRDVRYILPFFIQLFLFLTPVIYPLSVVSNKYSWIFYLNPLTGILDIFRAFLFSRGFDHPWYIFISLGSTLVLFCIGIAVFRKFEKEMADIL